MNSFLLDKWYMDVVDDDGRTFIGYVAMLHWRGLRLRYHGYLLLEPDAGVTRRNSFRMASMPRIENNQLTWNIRGINGCWRALDQPVEQTLLERPDGRLDWHCLQPRSAATVQITDQSPITGYGYVERLEATIPPWELPIRELRWGRFLSATDTIVWIEWRGPMPLFLITHNGQRYREGAIDSEQVAFGDYMLNLRERQPLREGALRSTVFARFPWVRKLLPLAVLRIEERKWRSSGQLMRNGSIVTKGWCIHETVIWP